MDELINKQKVVDLLKERASSLCGIYGDLGGACSGAAKLIMQMPSAQPVIVPCVDCKYWHSGSCEYPERVVNCQDYYVGDMETEAEHFCGYAERREVTE